MQRLISFSPSPLNPLHAKLFEENKVAVWVKRDDLLRLQNEPHDFAFSGNKWRKLQYNLIEAKSQGFSQLLTFGGAYSNHIAATASAGKLFNFKTVGIIRGERVTPLNPTLDYAEKCGMQLHFISRSSFRHKNDKSFQLSLKEKFGPSYLIPEGGTNALAIKGCEELAEELLKQTLPHPPDYVCLSCGTGGTMTGIISGMEDRCKIIGFSALKGDFLRTEIQHLLGAYIPKSYTNWSINTDYHFGGYAKFTEELIDFILQFYQSFQFPIDPVYTGKLFHSVFDLIKKGYFPSGSKIIILHTGGLQGIAGFNLRFGKDLPMIDAA